MSPTHPEGTAPSLLSSAAQNSVSPRLWVNRHEILRFFGLLTLAAILGFAIGLLAGASGRDAPFATGPEPLSMTQCITTTLTVLDLKQAPTPEILHQVLGYCYSLTRSQGLLKDFAVRELNFIQQYRANGVLMWMVVAITVSGVFLAGVQLMASYQLAGSNQASPATELSWRHDRVVLKSSITGLFILLISFAFFLVFVFYVYRFEKLENHNAQAPQPAPTLPMGGLGPPPGPTNP
jgi:hypothetical protein